MHIKQYIIRNNTKFAYKALNNKESVQIVLIIYCFICKVSVLLYSNVSMPPAPRAAG